MRPRLLLIRPAKGAVFRHIAVTGSRVADLAAPARITKQSMAYLVESLAASGYVAMAPDPEDGRAKRVRLTLDAKTGTAGNTLDENRRKPCRGRPFGLQAELKSESKKEIPDEDRDE